MAADSSPCRLLSYSRSVPTKHEQEPSKSGAFCELWWDRTYVIDSGVTPLRLRMPCAPHSRRTGLCRKETRHQAGNKPSAGEDIRPSTLDQDVPDDLAARAKGFLRFAVHFSANPTGVAKRHGELVLRFPLRSFTRPQLCFLRAPRIDLNHHPTQFSRVKVKHERTVRSC